MGMTRAQFVERVTRWLMPDRTDPKLAAAARERSTLDGVYSGKSARIHKLIRIAYLRGVRRGAGCAWEAQQPVSLRAVGTPGDTEREVRALRRVVEVAEWEEHGGGGGCYMCHAVDQYRAEYPRTREVRHPEVVLGWPTPDPTTEGGEDAPEGGTG